ncbi:hypothetical protein Dda_1380 [Drechslerella dactyloides]|uniref:Uncharacterized protein n=1 Tax=Drechslerella dactyloides TaxID=74499 RepID=A0AAD6NN08_DREDA|nr:hypothetical protein Dda_1380 [Drechslerella dactyloides]
MPLLVASHREIRTQFERSRDAAPGPDDAPPSERIKHAFEVANYLRQNVVQAVKADGEDVYITRNADAGGGFFFADGSFLTFAASKELRIHDETERGDNESIKTPLKGRVGRLEKCS